MSEQNTPSDDQAQGTGPRDEWGSDAERMPRLSSDPDPDPDADVVDTPPPGLGEPEEDPDPDVSGAI